MRRKQSRLPGPKGFHEFEGNMQSKINVIAAVGLALGGALGMAGAIATQRTGDTMGDRRRRACDGRIIACHKILSNRK
jgi:hypothetical protein